MTLPSGKFVLRLNPRMHQLLRQEAESKKLSLNQLIVQKLENTEDNRWSNDLSVCGGAGGTDLAGGGADGGASVGGAHEGTDLGEALKAIDLEVLKEIFTPEAVILFGSASRGEMRSGSDVDLLIVLPKSQPVNRQLYRRWDERFCSESDKIAAPQFSHFPKGDPASLWLEVAVEGEILYDPHGSARRQLTAIRHQIAKGGFVRKMSHGHPYWVKRTKSHAK
ncbi:MAG: hypothetical protein C5B49_13340 [Bdellovibrio sp.]|nr:MAG: hypothetical protein C5B49_13340 [Bdellovibrio sp.]